MQSLQNKVTSQTLFLSKKKLTSMVILSEVKKAASEDSRPQSTPFSVDSTQ